jgi:hypothetical protein
MFVAEVLAELGVRDADTLVAAALLPGAMLGIPRLGSLLHPIVMSIGVIRLSALRRVILCEGWSGEPEQ